MPKSPTPAKAERPHPIVAVLESTRVTQQDLAAATGYSKSYVSLGHRGLIRLSRTYRQRVAEYLCMPENVLFDVEDLAKS